MPCSQGWEKTSSEEAGCGPVLEDALPRLRAPYLPPDETRCCPGLVLGSGSGEGGSELCKLSVSRAGEKAGRSRGLAGPSLLLEGWLLFGLIGCFLSEELEPGRWQCPSAACSDRGRVHIWVSSRHRQSGEAAVMSSGKQESLGAALTAPVLLEVVLPCPVHCLMALSAGQGGEMPGLGGDTGAVPVPPGSLLPPRSPRGWGHAHPAPAKPLSSSCGGCSRRAED